jgi:hypothetical protein
MSWFPHEFLQAFRILIQQTSQCTSRWLFALLLGICACGFSAAHAAAPTITEVNGIPYGGSIASVTYGGGKYVAISSYGKVYTSTDAEAWSYSSSINMTSPRRVIYFNSRFVVAGGAGAIYTSPDAVTWTQQTSGTAQNFYAMEAYSGKLYAAGANRAVVTSSDGTSWSSVTINVGNATDDLMTITSGNGLLVIAARPASAFSTYYRSSTGASNSWNISTGLDFTTNGAYFLNDRFYAFYAGTRVETSTDAATWTEITSTSVTKPDSSTTVLGSPNQMFRGYHDGTNYLLFGSSGTYGWGTTIRSTNGSTYTMVAPTASIVAQGADLLNGKYFQWGNEGVVVSDDGLTYHFPMGSYNSIATNGSGGFSLVGMQGSTTTAVSATSSSWPTLSALATRTGTKSFNDVVWNGSQYVAVGENVIATSADGSSWTNTGTHTGNFYQSVLYQGGNYVVSGYDTGTYEWKIWRGSNLSSLSVVETLNTWFFRIKYENNTYFAVGYDNNTSRGVVYTSPDGITWTENTPPLAGDNYYYNDVVWTGSKYVVTGTSYGNSAYSFFSTSTTTPTNPASYSAKALITGAPGGSQIAADWSQGAFRYVNGHIVGIVNDLSVGGNVYPAYLLDSDDEGATWTATALDGEGYYYGSVVDGNSVKFVSGSGMLANVEFAVNNVPTVTTTAASSITKTTASVGGDVTSDAGSAVTERGVVYALTTTDPTPTYAEVNGTTVFKSTTSGTTGSYSIGLSGLTAGSQYSVAAYALNSNGTGTGSTETFTTTALSTNANLSALGLSSGTLSPGFAAGTISYTASVGNATTSITITPTTADSSATVTVNGSAVSSGAASSAIALAVGANSVTVVVTAENGTTTKTYTVTVTRAASSNANLSGLTPSSGSLSPSFAAGTTSYTASVNNATSSITITPTTADSTATVTVNGSTVTSGAASGAIAMNVGANTVTVVVTAQDGTTSKTYTVTVTRSVSSNADLSGLTPSSGSLSPSFAAGTISYTASVSNATSSITITPTTSDSASTVTVNGSTVSSGAASGAIALTVGTNTVTVIVTAEDGSTTKTYTVTVTRAASSNADLSGLTPSSGSLSPSFAAGTTSYTASVNNATSSITITPTTADSTATVTVNGSTVTSGAASGAIALTVGANTVTVIVTAEDSSTTKTYTVTVTRAGSSNADLSGLTPSNGSLSPSFAAGTTSYTASVGNATSSITITPTTADSTATVTVNGSTVSSGAASGAIALTVGTNTVTVIVTAEDGTTTKTYTVTVTRAASSNADLSGLTPSSGSLSPSFAAGTTSYTASVSNATSSITITPTTADSTATVTVNGSTVTSGAASGAIALTVGANTVTVIVTAEDGTTTKTYTVTVTRALSSNADLAGLTPSSGSLSPGFAAGTTSYTASVSNATSSITITPTTADSTATVTVNGSTVSSGAASGAIALTVGTNTVTVIVTAEDGTTTKTYTVTVTRALSSNADLSGLTPSSGSLSPSFAAGTTSYTASVSNATSSITITPTTADSTATVTVNGSTVTSGAASGAIALTVGANTITVVVTAADSTTKTYTIVVTNVNEAPVISGTPANSVIQDAAYSFTPSASDAYVGSVLTFSISNKPSWASFDTATGALTGTPANGDVGNHSGIVISVSDGALSAVLPTFSITVTNVNDAPTISGTPPTTATQDLLYSFVPTAADVDTGTTLTFSISNKPAWATFNTATGALTGTPTNSDIGSYSNIVISVSDGVVTTALTAFSITVGNTNDAPTISGTPATTATQGIAYSFVPAAADVDVGTTLVFSISNKPGWATFNTATGALTGTPANGDVGSHSGIVISVSDGALSAALPAFSITVANVNDAPTISGTPPTTATQDVLYSFVPTAADIDVGTTLTFSISNKPAWASFNTATGALTGTPTNSEIGSYSNIVISVGDGVTTTALTAFNITVLNSNDAPTISGTPATTATQGIAYSFVPVVADVDVGTTLVFSVSNKPGWATFDTATGALTGTPANADVGSHSGIVISVSDGALNAALPAFSITVANVNDAPTISGTPLTTATQDLLYSFVPTAADIDVGTTLTFSISNKPAWASFNTATGALTGTPTNSDIGSYSNIVISVSDGVVTTPLTAFNITVLNSNDAPTISGIPATTATQGIAYSFVPAAADVDAGTTLVFSINNKPGWANFNTATGALTGIPTNGDVGSHSGIVISVSDGALSSTLPAFSITVANVNDVPTISGTPATKVTQGVLYSFTPVAADIDVGTTLTFSISNKPAWASFNTATGQLSGTPARADVGSTNGIVIQVSDGTATAALAAFNLEVLNSNTAPVAQNSVATLREDEPAAITLQTSDAEGDLLNITITKQPAHGSLTAEGTDYRYVPAADYHGSDSFSFVARDAEFSSAEATVSLTITPVNDNPLVVADSFSVARLDTDRYTLTVLSNDTDVDGDRLTIDGATASTGTVTFSSAGLIYQAPAGYLGQVDLRYSVSDGQQGRASAEVRLQISGTAGGNLPVITLPADVEVNATALYTKVNLGVATAVDRNGLTLPVSLVDGQTFFAPGEHIAYWQATDSQGNKATKGQRVSVKPLISLSKDAVVTEGSDVTVQVLLNGPAPTYPVQVPYTVTGSANGNDHSLTSGVVVITSGTIGVIQFSVFEDAQIEGTENIQIALDPTLNLGSQSAMQVSIREDNIAPTVQLAVSQNDQPRLTVAKNQGVVTVKATVADQNLQDVISLQWNTAGLNGVDIDGDEMQFDPATQAPGVYMVAMTATDNGTPALTTSDQMYIVVVEALPALTTADTDGDLIPDSEEGFADADGDGIADYLDVITDCNVVPEEGKQQVSFLAEGSPGVCLRRGQDSVLSQSGGLQLLPTEVETDAAATNIGGIFDFIAYGLPVPGQTYQLVLPQRLPVPANAVYRKYNVVTGWVDFVSDSRNFVSSSAGERGFCPPPGDTRWSAGLTEGHWCVQVSVQDGGPNDADGIANGTIVDPSGVSIRNNGNRLPVAKPDAVTTRIGIAVEVKVLANDSDADGDTLKVSQVSAQFGQVEVMTDQQLRYVPAPQFSGTDRVTYSVTDGKGGTGSSELTVTVLPNNGPVAVNDVASTDDKTAVTIAVLANDSDPDGDVLTVLSASAQQGTVTIQSDKSLRYQPKAGFEGTDTVRYVIADSQGMQAQGQVVITVKAYKDVIVNNKSTGGAVGLLWFGLLLVAAWRRGVIALVLLMCLPAAAQASDWYGFVEAGQAKADRNAADIRAKLSGGTLLSLDQKDSAFGLGAGYQITETLAVELSYWDFGEANADISQSSLTPASYHELVKQVSPTLGEAIGAGGRFTVWQQQHWQLDVAAGVLNWQSEISSTMGGTVLTSKFDGTDLYYAVSAGYQLTNELSLSARWQRTQLQDNDVDLMALRLSYRF